MLVALACGLAGILFAPAARANVYATNIKINGALTNNPVAAPGNPVAISFILNEAATAGTTINIFSNSIVVRTLTIPSGSAGTLKGLNTVFWDGNDGSANPVALGSYFVSITTAATGFANWTQTSADSTTGGTHVYSCGGITVNVNSNSPYYGRVFIGNAASTTPSSVPGNVAGIIKCNADGSFADEGQNTAGGYNFAAGGGDAPVVLRYGMDDRVYWNDWSGAGIILASDMRLTTNGLVLGTGNYTGTAGNWSDFDVTDMNTTHGRIWLGDYNFPSKGVYAWNVINGVANPSDHTGTQVVATTGNTTAPNTGLNYYPRFGLMVDENTNVYVCQNRANTGDPANRAFMFPQWNGSTAFVQNSAWAVGGADDTFRSASDLAIDNRLNPRYCAVAMFSSSGGIRILNATNGATVFTNLNAGVNYATVAWDNAGNVYGGGTGADARGDFVGGLQNWRVFSPPGANTNTTRAYASVTMTNLPPGITTQPVNPGTLNQGTSLTLFVAATGTLPLSYQWLFNGTNLAGQTATNLFFASLQTSNSGTYSVLVTNTLGSITSSVVSLTVAAKPQVIQDPQSRFAYVNGAGSFFVSAIGSQPLSYQWQFAGSNISGATASNLGLVNLQTTNGGSYRCIITNTFGSTTSAVATLTVLQPVQSGGYVQAVMADGPLAFWRLDELSGTIARDSVGGFDGQYSNAVLGVSGYSTIDLDPAAAFGPGPNSYVGNIQGIGFAQPTNATGFSLEAWVNGPATQTSGAGIICKGNGGGGEQFNLDVFGGHYRFFVRDSTGAIPPGGTITSTVGPNGTWQHVVAVYDGAGSGSLYLYANGSQVGSQTASTNGILASSHPVSIASRQSGSGAYDNNFNGMVDEVAIYGTALNGVQVANHYNALLNWPGFRPQIAQQPQSLTIYPGASPTFSVVAGGDLSSMTYQWMFNGTNVIGGANSSSYTVSSAQPANAGLYSCALTNNFGSSNSAAAALTVLSTNGYESVILNDGPIAYWRLDETNGVIAHDYVGGNNGVYSNVTFGVPGYSLVDPDTAIGLSGSGNGSFVQIANTTPFNFPGDPPFTLETWVYFTNLTGVQRFIAAGSPGGYGFGANGANELRFTTFGVQDFDALLPTALVTNLWYHIVGVGTGGGTFAFYINGQLITNMNYTGGGLAISQPLLLGRSDTSVAPEQLHGRLDEVAIYNFALSSDQVLAHYNARYSSITPPIVGQPVALPPTNYASLSASLQAVADGSALTYQWYQGATLLNGQTAATLVLSPLQMTDGGTYHVQVSNPAGTNNSPNVTLTVLPIPTNAAQLNVTNGLVLHLPFDGDYADYSGRKNNGTNVGATTFVSPGAIGADALHYSTTVPSSYNYVTLGFPTDLLFGSDVDFSVSYWVRQDPGSLYGDLPFLGNAINSTRNPGFAFAPTGGGWAWSLEGGGFTVVSVGAANTINDGNWHHVVHTISRTSVGITYLDGIQVDSQSVAQIGNIDTGLALNIGQDPTGTYAVTAAADLDDMGVWRRVLSPLEVSGIYVAGLNNSVSFATGITPPPVLSFQLLSNGQLELDWSTGTLQSSSQVTGPYTDVPGASSPWPVNMSLVPKAFYRLRN